MFRHATAGAPTCGARGEESEVARRVRMFWRSLGPNSEAPVYGADTLGTLFSEEDKDSWNVGRLVSTSCTSFPRLFLSSVVRRHWHFLYYLQCLGRWKSKRKVRFDQQILRLL